jgi:hypothetical protein
MKKTGILRIMSLIVCFVLIAAMALTTIGCGSPKTLELNGITVPSENVIGEGEREFVFTVTDGEGSTAAYIIKTDKTTVGGALMECGLISGEEGPYGLYVKTVNGVTADYDVDGTYWAFYVDGEYAMSGVDTTDINAGATYSFKVEK